MISGLRVQGCLFETPNPLTLPPSTLPLKSQARMSKVNTVVAALLGRVVLGVLLFRRSCDSDWESLQSRVSFFAGLHTTDPTQRVSLRVRGSCFH